ncbi:hypothetical protein EVAR_51811_1 [Eumeta japonica]|uniref:Uncharacterized protein n=1 Tax=Eumeta variegata TaxID=151549 RepID=A0A4C1XYI4_EUMVA|nr:hypothetical protein EVAR_51811_1 [Eumeta japonica]
MPKGEGTNCIAIARIIKDLCSCSENGAWSPEMTTGRRRDSILKSELTNMSAVSTRIMNLAKMRNLEITEQPKLEKSNLERFSDCTTDGATARRTMFHRNIDNYLQSRRLFAIDEELYERPVQPAFKYSSCGENWSLSKSWSTRNSNETKLDRVVESKPQFGYLERIEEAPTRKRKKEKRMKEQLRYDRNIKRHIRIRVMLSLRMRRYIKRRKKANVVAQNANIPPRRFPKGSSTTSSFGTRSYKSVLVDKISDGTVLFDVHEARNTTMELCHDFRDDLDTLEIALRAGNFR